MEIDADEIFAAGDEPRHRPRKCGDTRVYNEQSHEGNRSGGENPSNTARSSAPVPRSSNQHAGTNDGRGERYVLASGEQANGVEDSRDGREHHIKHGQLEPHSRRRCARHRVPQR